MDEKWAIFLQGTPPQQKVVIFAKMSRSIFNTKIRVVSLFYEKGAKFSKKLFDKKWSIFTLGGQVMYIPHFCPLPPEIDGKQSKNRPKIYEKRGTFPRGPPREKLGIFAKMSKIGPNINIRAVSLFCKKCVKFSKKSFWQIWTIFDLGGHVVHNSPFLLITPVN